MKKIFIYCVFITVMLIGCDKCNENTPITPVTPANTSELIPLAKCNYWKMEGSPDSNNVKKTSYQYCLRDTVINGLTWWIMSLIIFQLQLVDLVLVQFYSEMIIKV